MAKLIRAVFGESALIPLVSVVLGLFLGALIMLLGAYNPLQAYASLLDRAFGDMYSIGETIRQITPLIFTGLAVAFAFRTGLFNIGAEGQFIVGSLAAAYVGIAFILPWYIHAPLSAAAGGLAAGIWGAIAGYLKAKRGVHEVISTIMLNFIALYLSNYIVKTFMLEPGQQRSKIVEESSWLSFPGFTQLFGGSRIHAGIFIAIVCAVLFYVILWRTTHGFELRAVGLNPHASEYAGMNVRRSLVLAMFVSGSFAGFGGAAEVLGVFHYQAISASFPGYGFLGIAVALLGRNSASGIVAAAVFMGVLTFGATGMKFGAGVPVELIHVVIALVIFFVAAGGMIKYAARWLRKDREEGV
jgi:ABC-type uncharacterized transport system permease subunit